MNDIEQYIKELKNNNTMIEKYLNCRYYYPPRPEYVIPPSELPNYEGDHCAQPKMNGACVEIYIQGNEFRYFGRHKNESISNFKLNIDDLKVLNCGNNNWNVIVGEYMNKNKNSIDGKPWNHKFVVFDIMVYNGEYLLGTTFEERIKLLDKIFGTVDENEYLYKITDNIFRVKTFYDNFVNRWNDIIKVDMLEGFVLKKRNQKLVKAFSEKNNMSHKCRKETKNYRY
jgi:hypothetical protein